MSQMEGEGGGRLHLEWQSNRDLVGEMLESLSCYLAVLSSALVSFLWFRN